MTTAPTSASASADSSGFISDAKQASVQETLQKVDASLIPAIESFVDVINKGDLVDNKKPTSPSPPSGRAMPGLDFLHVKNDLLLSYLIDLVVWLRDSSRDGRTTSATVHLQRQQRRLIEMRTILDRARGLDKKLRYQIDKLLAVASSSSTAFVTSYGQDDDEDDVDTSEDPLHFRPDLSSLQVMGDDGDGDGDEESTGSDGRDDDSDGDDDELKAARATLAESKHKFPSKAVASKAEKRSQKLPAARPGGEAGDRNVYRAPHLTAVPYTHDARNKQREASKRERKRLQTTEMAQMFRSQFGDAPELEDIHGGGSSDYGKQRAASRKLNELEAERNKYEESAMIRLTTSRKEKKDRKRVKQMEGSNLAMMAGLGNLVQESKAFFESSSNNFDDEGDDMMRMERGGGKGDRTMKRMRGRGGVERANDGQKTRHHNGKRSRGRS
jgi:U3 small nucleolar ribonucleoprotein protein LCP5